MPCWCTPDRSLRPNIRVPRLQILNDVEVFQSFVIHITSKIRCQSQCKPNAMNCISIAEVQPDFSPFWAQRYKIPKIFNQKFPKFSIFTSIYLHFLRYFTIIDSFSSSNSPIAFKCTTPIGMKCATFTPHLLAPADKTAMARPEGCD